MTDIALDRPAVGDELAPGYTILRTVNQGSLFDVHEVWSDERHTRCAAKVIRPDRVHETKARRRLLREARLLTRLTHPHIVRSYEVCREPQPTLVLEALPGMTLQYWLSEVERLEQNDLVHLAEHLCSAVAYLHRSGVLHLDLKPGNLLCSYGVVRVIDLSLARPPGCGHRGAGTHVYLAPEQAIGEEVGSWTDVWGVGVVLWEAAAGVRPFQRPDDDHDAYEQLRRRAEPIAAHRALPADLTAAIDGCLEQLPANRPTVHDLWQVVERYLD